MEARTDQGAGELAAGRLRPLRPSTVAVMCVLAALTVALPALGTVSTGTAIGALLILWISAVPALVHLQGLDDTPTPVIPFSGLYYAVFFGLPIFAAPLAYHLEGKVALYFRVALPPMPAEVALLAAGGIAAMIASYYAAKVTVTRRLPRLRLASAATPDARTLQALYWMLIVGSLAFRYSRTLQSVPSVGQLLDPIGYLALGGLYLQWRAGHLPRWQAGLVVLIVAPLEIYWRLRYFFLTDLLFLPLFFAFILWREWQFKVLAVLVLLGVIAAASYNVTTAVRTSADTLGGKVVSAAAYVSRLAAQNWRETLQNARGEAISVDARASALVHRVGQIWVFQHVYRQSPDPVPYLNGETYRPLLTSFIPRLIYPDKPMERAGGEFGFRYGFAEDKNTSVNIPWLTELLANFGPRGVVIGMALLGLFLAVLDRLFNARGMSEAEYLIGLTLIFKLGYQESNLSVMTGSLLPLFICLYLYFRVGGPIVHRLLAWMARA